MRRFPLGLAAGLLSAACAGLLAVGCGGPVEKDDEPLPRSRKGSKGSSAVVAQVETLKAVPVSQDKYTGTITGSIKWAGEKPDLDRLTQDLQKGMIKDTDYCLRGKHGTETSPIQDYETFQQTYRIGDNGNLGNVFVWIQPEPGYAFDVPDAQLPATKEVRLHQPHCAFLPHCQVIFAARYKKGDLDPTGCQKLVVMNDARVSHNAKVQGGPLTGTVNKLLGSWDGKGKMQEEVLELRPEKDPVTVSCDVHTWMRAYLRVFDHPYAAVSSVGANLTDAKKPVWENLKDPKVGTFEIKGVPVGAKVRLFAWHEQLGHLPETGPNGKSITLGEKNAFPLEAKPK
jgi:hypothetical protein